MPPAKKIAVTLLGLCLLLPAALTKAGENHDSPSPFGPLIGKSLEDLADLTVVAATGVGKPVKTAPAVSTVITAADLDRSGATTLDEALENVPGLHVLPSGFQWFSSLWSLRGLQASGNPHMLLLINGVPFQDSYNGNRGYLFQLPTSMISRIEVVRGPGSALHGADAFSGVVNVITKDQEEIDGTRLGLRSGSFDTHAGWLQHGGEHGGWDLALGIDWQKTQGDDDRVVGRDFLHFGKAPLPARPDLSLASGPLDTRRELTDGFLALAKGDFTGHIYGSLIDSAAGPGGAQAVTYGNNFQQKDLLAGLNYKNGHSFSDWELSGRIHYHFVDINPWIQYYPTDYLNMLGNPLRTQHEAGIETAGLYTGFPGHRLRLGAGARQFDLEPDQYKNFGPAAGANQFGPMVHVTDPAHIYISPVNRTVLFGLLQDEWKLARDWELTAGARYDHYSDFGGTINPRAALVWEARYDLVAKLLYGQAFRAPSFSDLYTKNNPVGIGSPTLKPEELETIELALDWQPVAALRLAINLFGYKAEELIEYTGPLPQVASNYGEQEGRGFETEADWQISDSFLLRGSFAYQRSENKRTGSVVPDAPAMQFKLNPQWAFLPDWTLDGQYVWIAERHRASGDPRPDIDDFGRLNLTLRRQNIARHWTMTIAARNLFNEDAREPSPYDPSAPLGAWIPDDYPLEGRALWAEISYAF